MEPIIQESEIKSNKVSWDILSLVKSLTLAVILAALIISVVFADEADAAGLVKRAISTAGTWAKSDLPATTVSTDQANTYTGTNAQALGTSFITSGSDPADAGAHRHSNAELICWEASPAGTDVCISVDTSEDFLFDSNTNNININSNPLTNAVSIALDADPADAGDVMLSNAGTIAWEASPAGADVDFQVDANEDYLLDTDARNFNFNSNPLTNAVMGANLDMSTFAKISGADPADAGVDRYSNTEQQCWEASPTGTDQCVGNNTTEDYVWDTVWNQINLNSNPVTNVVLGGTVDGAGNILDNIASINDNSGAESTSGFIDMANAVLLCWEASPAGADVCFSVDATEDIDFTDTDINFVDLGTNPLSFTETTDPANPSNTQGQIYANAGRTGSLPKWKMDSRVEYPMIGVPMPPFKWGEIQPVSASAAKIGLLNLCTISTTASFVYDTTDSSTAILSTTATTDGVNGGISCVDVNTDVYRGDQNAYMYSKWEQDKITTDRVFIGFTSSATILPNNADTILDALSGAGLCIRTTDTVYQFCSNDGTGATAYASLTTTQDAGAVHYFEVYSYDEGTTWCGALDGGTPVCSSTATDIPAPTTRMYAMSSGETDGGGSAILWTQYLMFTRNDK